MKFTFKPSLKMCKYDCHTPFSISQYVLIVSVLLLTLNSCVATNNPTPVEKHGQLSVNGNKIVDKNGEPVQLKGMSLFWSQERGEFYNYECIKWLYNDWNCEITRAAMAVENGGYLENPEIEMAKVDTAVLAAIKLGMYIFIDWHDHHAQRHLKESKAFFAQIAQKYSQYPNVIYEIYNEPLNDITWADSVKPYCESVIDTIRNYDTKNIILCGTTTWSQDVDVASEDPIKGENIAYTLHYYAATHKAELRAKAEKAMSNGIALMVSEFGTVYANGDGDVNYDESKLWWNFCDKYQLSWCCWSICDKAESSAALKPGASKTGGWSLDDLNPSGILVRSELRGENK